ncbi:MAG: MFS transporter [Mangrovicoccus sp.]|nr:MFS transporter [Mangrovicoccus sp.]
MLDTLNRAWALLLGMFLLMVGNGLQGTLLGVRGAIEGFTTLEMSLVMSAYFAGFLGGSQIAPELIRRVGHVRVFAALASFISAVLILYPTITNPAVWILLRVAIGFCFSGVYVTAESWLNHAASNENRGQALSLYMIVQMGGIVSAQGVLLMGDPSGFILFIIPSVLVSISFAPILLSVQPTPVFDTTKPMSLGALFRNSPLGVVGMFLMGGVFSALFGMASVYGSEAGMSVGQISLFVAAIYLGGLICQAPIGYISDRMDRRQLVVWAALTALAASLLPMVLPGYWVAVTAGFIIGGMSNPLYALIIAHTNDYLDFDDMAAASGRLMFVNGVGAVAGPLIAGGLMGRFGPAGFFVYLAVLMASLAGYAVWRTTQRAATPVEDTLSYAPILPTATPVAMEVAQEVAIETAQEDDEATGDNAAAV